VGMDTVSGQLRMTFGFSDLLRGINFLVAVIGLFGISEILLTMEERLALRGHTARISLRVLWNVWKDLPRYWITLLRSSAIGAWRCDRGLVHGLHPRQAFLKEPGRFWLRAHRRGIRAGNRGACIGHRCPAADAGAGNSRFGYGRHTPRRADGLGSQSRTAAVR